VLLQRLGVIGIVLILIYILYQKIATFLKEFSTFLIISFEAFPAKTQAISLPYPGLAASKLASKLQSSLAKSVSELCANTPQLTIEAPG
jgi:hypothetical protein